MSRCGSWDTKECAISEMFLAEADIVRKLRRIAQDVTRLSEQCADRMRSKKDGKDARVGTWAKKAGQGKDVRNLRQTE
jgi:hypothetical protein